MKRNITLGTHNLRIRVTAEFLFSCQNKEEQITLYVYLKNFIKEKYGYILDGIKTKYTFPEVVLISLKNMLYGKDIPLKDVEKDLDIYLAKNSNGGITPVWRDGKENAKFYELEYVYAAIRLQLTGTPQLDDGDKKDMAYDNYTIRFPAIVEFYIPINYVLRSPELIPSAIGRPNLVDDFLVMDPIPDKDNNIQILKIIKKYKDNASRSYIDNRQYYLVARDEFALESPEDYYDIRMALCEDYRRVFDSLLPEEKKACHKVYLFENDVLLDEGKYYDFDENTWRLHIHNGDIETIQMIEVYSNIDLLNVFIKRQVRRDRLIKKGEEHARA